MTIPSDIKLYICRIAMEVTEDDMANTFETLKLGELYDISFRTSGPLFKYAFCSLTLPSDTSDKFFTRLVTLPYVYLHHNTGGQAWKVEKWIPKSDRVAKPYHENMTQKQPLLLLDFMPVKYEILPPLEETFSFLTPIESPVITPREPETVDVETETKCQEMVDVLLADVILEKCSFMTKKGAFDSFEFHPWHIIKNLTLTQ